MNIEKSMVGNWVLENGKAVQIDAFDLYGNAAAEDPSYDDGYRNIKDPEGIPLTQDLLKKLGAVSPYEDQPDYYDFCLLFFKWHDEYGLCLWDKSSVSILNGTIHYKYLHELQNLISILTGKEMQNVYCALTGNKFKPVP